MRPLGELARDLGLADEDVEPRLRHAAKVRLDAARGKPRRAKLVVVTATTPTTEGEGKTVTVIGLAEALRAAGQRVVATLRQPSMGPLLGLKGGATGGGRAAVEPADEINLHFTGDMHAVAAAQDLVAAMADAHLYHGNALDLDPEREGLPRCLDVDDRQLRHVRVGLGGPKDGVPRETGFVITAASETMSILSLAEDLADLKARLGAIIVGFTTSGKPLTARDIIADGAAAALLRDAMMPNLVQTSDGTPALVHGGPFANVSHGHSSVIADRLALSHGDVVVTETGFGADLGYEKFVDLIASPRAGLEPDLAVLVTTVRALAAHGLENLDAHLRIVRGFGTPVVVAVNRFPADSDADVARVLDACRARGVPAAAHDAYARGAEGAAELARVVMDALRAAPGRPPLAPAYAPREDALAKLRKLAKLYGADGVTLDERASAALDELRALGYGALPVCVAKTPLSLTDDAKRAGAPRDWTLTIHDVRVEAGAGYLVAIAGAANLMPGLGHAPRAQKLDVDPATGRIVGLS